LECGTQYWHTKKPQNFVVITRIPKLKQLDCEIETISFEEPIDSSNIDPEEWAEIATMVETNYLDFDGCSSWI
jgi:L-asparaginase/Glu-tRNA(Gln) amidotransferase subunit D